MCVWALNVLHAFISKVSHDESLEIKNSAVPRPVRRAVPRRRGLRGGFVSTALMRSRSSVSEGLLPRRGVVPRRRPIAGINPAQVSAFKDGMLRDHPSVFEDPPSA